MEPKISATGHRLLVRFYHVARFIVNANDGIITLYAARDRYPGHPSLFALKQVAPSAVKHSGRYLFLVLGGSLLARGLWHSAKLKNILGDLGDRPGFWSNLL
jgi:hypothetical protein